MSTSIYQSKISHLKALNNLFIEMSAKSCNQRCKYCYIDFPMYKKFDDFISIDKVKEALIDTKNEEINCIYLTGAEPMTHPNFNAILRLCLKRANVCICTNGSFINEKKARFLKKVEEESNNEIIFQVSLDHWDEVKNDDIRYRGAYRHAIFAIKHLARYNFKPIISVTNYYNETLQDFYIGFEKVFRDSDFDIDICHLQIRPCHIPNSESSNLENFSDKWNRLDCEYSRILTVDGVFACPFLAGDYRGRCGSSFKDYSDKNPLETSFCEICLKSEDFMFCVNFDKFK